MLIDTHAHLDFPDFANDLDAILNRATAAGVTRIITIGTSIEGSRRAVALAEKYSQVFAVVGVHPNSAGEAEDNFIDELRAIAQNPRVVALGETGLDYHYLPSSKRPAESPPRSATKPPATSTPRSPTARTSPGKPPSSSSSSTSRSSSA